MACITHTPCIINYRFVYPSSVSGAATKECLRTEGVPNPQQSQLSPKLKESPWPIDVIDQSRLLSRCKLRTLALSLGRCLLEPAPRVVFCWRLGVDSVWEWSQRRDRVQGQQVLRRFLRGGSLAKGPAGPIFNPRTIAGFWVGIIGLSIKSSAGHVPGWKVL